MCNLFFTKKLMWWPRKLTDSFVFKFYAYFLCLYTHIRNLMHMYKYVCAPFFLSCFFFFRIPSPHWLPPLPTSAFHPTPEVTHVHNFICILSYFWCSYNYTHTYAFTGMGNWFYLFTHVGSIASMCFSALCISLSQYFEESLLTIWHSSNLSVVMAA